MLDYTTEPNPGAVFAEVWNKDSTDARCSVEMDGHRCIFVAEHTSPHYSSFERARLAKAFGCIDKLTDALLERWASDRTGRAMDEWEDQLTVDRALSMVDELVKWRRWLKTDAGKAAMATKKESKA